VWAVVSSQFLKVSVTSSLLPESPCLALLSWTRALVGILANEKNHQRTNVDGDANICIPSIIAFGCSGKLVSDDTDHQHSSASFYELGIAKNHPVFDFKTF
jgi:hypothetical protein